MTTNGGRWRTAKFDLSGRGQTWLRGPSSPFFVRILLKSHVPLPRVRLSSSAAFVPGPARRSPFFGPLPELERPSPVWNPVVYSSILCVQPLQLLESPRTTWAEPTNGAAEPARMRLVAMVSRLLKMQTEMGNQSTASCHDNILHLRLQDHIELRRDRFGQKSGKLFMRCG